MAHFAELDENNKVIRVLVTDNNDSNGDEGYQWLVDNLGGTWIKTSYNNKIRKQFASTNYTYDELNDVFIKPQPYPSWTLDNNFDWQPPTPYPNEGIGYWDEENLKWQQLGN
jgi:hypothetical protein